MTVNARESAAVARGAAKALALALPIAHYDDAVDRAFNVRSLPTIVLADREGRIRARWDNYVPDFETEVAAKVRALLDEKPDARRRVVAQVMAGAGRLGVLWTREMTAPVLGVALLDDPDAGRLVGAASGDQILLVRPDGSIATRRKLPPASAGRLRRVGGSGPALYDAVSFRPGRPELLWIDTRGGATHAWTAASPLLDVAALPPSAGEPAQGRLVLASIAGVSVAGPVGAETAWPDAAGETRAIAVSGSGAGAIVASLAASGRLRRFDAGGRLLQEIDAPEGSRAILIGGDGGSAMGVLPASTRAFARGRVFPGGREQAVAATDAGQLVVVELATGSVAFRARWPGIDEICVGDLDGDGIDEIAVASGKSITLLGAAPAPSAGK